MLQLHSKTGALYDSSRGPGSLTAMRTAQHRQLPLYVVTAFITSSLSEMFFSAPSYDGGIHWGLIFAPSWLRGVLAHSISCVFYVYSLGKYETAGVWYAGQPKDSHRCLETPYVEALQDSRLRFIVSTKRKPGGHMTLLKDPGRHLR